jgi:hypothetical protein
VRAQASLDTERRRLPARDVPLVLVGLAVPRPAAAAPGRARHAGCARVSRCCMFPLATCSNLCLTALPEPTSLQRFRRAALLIQWDAPGAPGGCSRCRCNKTAGHFGRRSAPLTPAHSSGQATCRLGPAGWPPRWRGCRRGIRGCVSSRASRCWAPAAWCSAACASWAASRCSRRTRSAPPSPSLQVRCLHAAASRSCAPCHSCSSMQLLQV